MNDQLHTLLSGMLDKFFAFLPALISGFMLLFIGWFLAWFIKRLAIQVCAILRIEGPLARFQWGKALSKADVRYGLYNLIGNISFLITFLIFVYYALINWGLNFLSQLLGDGIMLFPRIVGAMFIFITGWLITIAASRGLLRILLQEEIKAASFIAQFAKIMLIVFFAAMSLTELGLARQIVLIGFTTVYVSLGTIAVIYMLRSSKIRISEPPAPPERVENPSCVSPDKKQEQEI